MKQNHRVSSLKSAASMTTSLKQAGKGINWSLTLSSYDFLAFASSGIILQLYFTFKNKMMYATEPADLQPHSPRCCSKASARFWNGFQHRCKHWGGKTQQLVSKEAVKFCWYRPGLGSAEQHLSSNSQISTKEASGLCHLRHSHGTRIPQSHLEDGRM